MNLLKETIDDIKQSGHTPEDIVFIGSIESGHACTWDEFQILADVEYDSGFGSQNIAHDLVIVFSDNSKMWRHEYDGSENWSYSSPVTIPTDTKPIRALTLDNLHSMWDSLADIHKKLDNPEDYQL